MEQDRVLRQHLLWLLDGGNAHMSFDDAIAQFPREYLNAKAPHVTYTPWHILEHLRITQWDILEFIRNPAYVSPEWPKGYWPAPDAEADVAMWEKTVTAFRADLQALRDLVNDPRVDLYEPLPHGSGQTILREILLVADHNAYHIGEFAVLRQVMQTWPPSHH
jgi:hypothetical protein